MAKSTDFRLPTKICGIEFRNPFYVAAGPTTMTVEQLERIRDTGWGGASLKLTVYPLPYINRVPRYGYYPDKHFLVFTAERRLVLDELLRLIDQGKKRTPELVLFANITYAGNEGVQGWAKMARKCEEAGIDIVELNMCCPNMSFNVEVSGEETGGPKTGASMGENEDVVKEIVAEVKKSLNIPLFVKLTPEGGQIARVAKSAFDAGADAVGSTANRLGVPPIDLDKPGESMFHLQKEVGMACMSGEWLKPLGMRDVYEMRKMVGPDKTLTATGGVSTWRDGVEMAMCGADLVGICTATLVKGFGFMPEFIRGVKRYMNEKGYEQFRDMRDILVPAITSAPNLTLYEGHAKLQDTRPVAPCVIACPNSVPAQGYIRKVARGEFEEAYQLIVSKSPLQSICGKICDRPCEQACTRGSKDEPVMIRAIKHFVMDMAEKEGWKPEILNQRGDQKPNKVAIIGSGPAGLSAAYDLSRAGYKVTIFEAWEKPGGILRYAVPRFRLMEEELDREISIIKNLGIEIKTKTTFGRDVTFQSLKSDGYEAFFLGIGAQEWIKPKIPGEEAEGCYSALDFLQSVAKGERLKLGEKVAVIGGGFAAIDAARTAIRLGANQVFVLYRRTKDEMPATEEDVAEAEEEGVRTMYLVSPEEIITKDARVTKIRLMNNVLGEEEPSSRRKPVEVPGTQFTLDVDTVIFAMGQFVVTGEIRLSDTGTITVDEETLQTSIPDVFAGGDCVLGPKNVISAIAMGKRAAVSIDRYLSGEKAFLQYDPPEIETDKEIVLMRHGQEARTWRQEETKLPAKTRTKNFNGYTDVLTKEQAIREAMRCMACGCGAGCEACIDSCNKFAFSMNDDGRIEMDEEKCVGCGMCIHLCPNDCIEMIQTSMQLS